MTSDDENPKKKSLNPLEDFELDDENDTTDEDFEDVDDIIDASPLGSELDNEDYAGDDETDFAAELSAMPNDDIDTDIDSTPSFDTEEMQGADKKRGGMRKMLAPALVLVVAAGAAGYIMMNPAIIGGDDAGRSSTDMANATSDFEAEAEALRQAQNQAASNQERSGLGGMGGDLPQPSVNMNEEDETSAVVEGDNAMLSPDETIDDIMNAGDEMSAVLEDDEATPEAALDDNEQAFENDLPEEVSVEPPAMAANETPASTEADVVPRGPKAMTAEPVTPVEEEVVEAEAAGEELDVAQAGEGGASIVEPESKPEPEAEVASGPESEPAGTQDAAVDENDIFERDFQNIVSEDKSFGSDDRAQTAQPSAPRDNDSFYDSEMRVPQGQIAGPRIVNPRVEPATSLVVATQDYKADDQESLVVAASRALKLRRYDAALDMFSSLYSKNKRDKRILMGLAVAQQNTGRVESAIKSYEELLEIDPENADAMVNMLGLIKEQYPSVALRRLLDLQDQFPSHAGLAAQIGITQADMGQYQEAMRYLGKAASLDPRNPQHLFNMAIVADRQGKTKEAIGFYEQALEVDTVYASGRSLPRETIYDRLSNLRRR